MCSHRVPHGELLWGVHPICGHVLQLASTTHTSLTHPLCWLPARHSCNRRASPTWGLGTRGGVVHGHRLPHGEPAWWACPTTWPCPAASWHCPFSPLIPTLQAPPPHSLCSPQPPPISTLRARGMWLEATGCALTASGLCAAAGGSYPHLPRQLSTWPEAMSSCAPCTSPPPPLCIPQLQPGGEPCMGGHGLQPQGTTHGVGDAPHPMATCCPGRPVTVPCPPVY